MFAQLYSGLHQHNRLKPEAFTISFDTFLIIICYYLVANIDAIIWLHKFFVEYFFTKEERGGECGFVLALLAASREVVVN